MSDTTPDQASPWYVALAAITKRSKPVNEQDLPAPVRQMNKAQIAQLNRLRVYTAPKQITKRESHEKK